MNIEDGKLIDAYVVYALMNKQHEIYVGYTSDLSHRLSQHNKDLGAVATKNKGPWYLFLVEAYEAEVDARKRESNIILTFESGVFLQQTYWSRAAIQDHLGLEHTDWDAKILNNRKNETVTNRGK
jgi:predicted GIY-YIG superfamily endonuclease